uniref:SET domain-containing protein n=1 Tax=Hyaloperonospora arabidopsidis (strain Emoy2) TaxID=559515 RepID=M4B768_HYAAE
MRAKRVIIHKQMGQSSRQEESRLGARVYLAVSVGAIRANPITTPLYSCKFREPRPCFIEKTNNLSFATTYCSVDKSTKTMAMVKKFQVAIAYPSASFVNALEVVLTSEKTRWRYLDAKSILAIGCLCSAARTMLHTWLDTIVRDISQGKEVMPIPVQFPLPAQFSTKLVAVVQLLQSFTYTTAVHVPVVSEQHSLPSYLTSKQQQDTRCQQVRRGRQVSIFLAKCKAKGWGVYAAQQIKPNEFIGEYTGELISTREVQCRYRYRYDLEALNYVMSLREHMARKANSALTFDIVRTNVDASSCGNVTRFLNHSCSSNVTLEAVRVDSFVPRLALFTRTRIDAGQELTIDYGEGSRNVVQDANERPQGARDCKCGAHECRGYLPCVLE